MFTASPLDVASIRSTLSSPRMSTYLKATGGDVDRALALYEWNARASAALMLPARFAEVTTRNAVDEALTADVVDEGAADVPNRAGLGRN